VAAPQYTIYPLKVAECDNEGPRVYYLGDCREVLRLHNLFWIVKGESLTIAVDTGFTGDVGRKFMPAMIQEPHEDPFAQLDRIGVDPAEVDHVILTHLHFDHLSSPIERFTRAQVWVNRRELAYVPMPPHPWFGQFVDTDAVNLIAGPWRDRLSLVEEEAQVAPGIDIFRTAGHTPGHQSVAVNTAAGCAVLAGDAAFTYRNLEEDIPPGFNWNLEECFASMARIRRRADFVLPGHDALVFIRHGEKIP
jgi:glyoxylase-like metal-dependent hydrolase (beta-lactamase superfamily II)